MEWEAFLPTIICPEGLFTKGLLLASSRRRGGGGLLRGYITEEGTSPREDGVRTKGRKEKKHRVRMSKETLT